MMLGELLKRGLGQQVDLQDEAGAQQQQVQQMPMFGQGGLGDLFRGFGGGMFQQTPQGPDLYQQYNNPLMFLRRF